MNTKNSCPCCSRTMLHHLSNRHSYWYCSSCRIEMPNIEQKKPVNKKKKIRFTPQSIKSTVAVS